MALVLFEKYGFFDNLYLKSCLESIWTDVGNGFWDSLTYKSDFLEYGKISRKFLKLYLGIMTFSTNGIRIPKIKN